MPSFSPWKPKNGRYNLQDPVAPYLAGSPAGGYWTTAHDLAKFGQWVYKKSTSDPVFRSLIEKYGQEFYQQVPETPVSVQPAWQYRKLLQQVSQASHQCAVQRVYSRSQ